MTRRRRTVPLVLLLCAAAPELAHACSACVDLASKNRAAFFSTTVLLSLLPLGMLGGTAYWLRRRARAVAAEPVDGGHGF